MNGKFAIDKEKEMELNGEKLICFYRDDTGEIEIIKRKDYSNYVDWNEDRTRYNAFGWNRKYLQYIHPILLLMKKYFLIIIKMLLIQ